MSDISAPPAFIFQDGARQPFAPAYLFEHTPFTAIVTFMQQSEMFRDFYNLGYIFADQKNEHIRERAGFEWGGAKYGKGLLRAGVPLSSL